MIVYWPNGSLSIPRVTSEFSPNRRNPVTGVVQPHLGIDIVGWADVLSPVDGLVIFAGYNGGAGNEVRIRASNGDVFRLMHHARLYVRSGDRVTARQPVGRMGTTGNSTGVHSHFETHDGRLGNPINPRDFLARANANPASGGGGIEVIMDKETFIAWLWEFYKFRSRDNGGADYKGGPTIFERLTDVVNRVVALVGAVNPDEPNGGEGWLPFRNAMSRWLIYHSRIDGPEGKGATLHERLNQIEQAVRDGGDVKITIDAATLAKALADPKVAQAFASPIAKAVNDDAANRMRS